MVQYDAVIEAFVFITGEEVICLGAETREQAIEEAQMIVEEGC